MAVTLFFCVTSAPSRAQQQDVIDPNLSAAVDQINTITPHAVAQQTLDVGVFDGLTKKFNWILPLVYPQGIPDFKKSENGGPVHPRPIAMINSFNVKYRFAMVNGTGIIFTLTTPDQDGNPTSIQATLEPDGQHASLTFHPYSVSQQQLAVFYPGGQTGGPIVTVLQPELGAFIVPHLLIAIIYEPPGAGSAASYATTSTAGTTVSLSFARSVGLIQTVNSNTLLDTMAKIATAGKFVLGIYLGFTDAGAVSGEIGQGLSFLNDLIGNQQAITTTSTTSNQTSSVGWSLSLTDSYSTIAHQYPGQGDVFVILKDVVFAYLAVNNKVILAPVAYSRVRAEIISQLQTELPAATVQSLRDLDLMLNPGPQGIRASTLLPVWLHGGIGRQPASRLGFFTTTPCETQASHTIDLHREDINSSASTQTQTTLVVSKFTGILESVARALGGGASDNFYSFTYSSSVQNWQGTAVAASITLSCPTDTVTDDVNIYFDRLFGTFLSVRGGPTPQSVVISGSVTDLAGKKLPARQVILRLGSKSYVAFTDKNGDFAIRAKGLPMGSGSIKVASTSVAVTHSGTPVKNIVIKVAR